MKKKFTAQSGIFNPRICSAFVLCAIGVLLALIGFAATPQPPSGTAESVGSFAPIVSESLYHGVSPNLRDLPLATPEPVPPYVIDRILSIHPPRLVPMLP